MRLTPHWRHDLPVGRSERGSDQYADLEVPVPDIESGWSILFVFSDQLYCCAVPAPGFRHGYESCCCQEKSGPEFRNPKSHSSFPSLNMDEDLHLPLRPSDTSVQAHITALDLLAARCQLISPSTRKPLFPVHSSTPTRSKSTSPENGGSR